MADRRTHLPPEILEMIIGYLDAEDVVNCSAVNSLWYLTARRFLERTTRMHLCRWPDTLSSNVRNACLAGDLSIKHFPVDELKQLKTLKLWYDEPGLLPNKTTKKMFSYCLKLARLEILNVLTLENSHVDCILEQCTPGLRLRLSLVHSDSSSIEVLNQLEEYQELFEELEIEYQDSERVFGWYPIHTSKSKFRLRHSASLVLLTGPGLSQIEFLPFCYIKSLKLEKCSFLNENALLLISQVNVEFFSIDSFSARESIWITSFKTGFSSLKSFSSTNNQFITNEALDELCKKNLQSVVLDFRKGSSETSSIPHLYKLINLVHLKIITNQTVTQALVEGINCYWPNMKTLEVEECSLGNNESTETIKTFKSILESKPNIKFIHKINCTKFHNNYLLRTSD